MEETIQVEIKGQLFKVTGGPFYALLCGVHALRTRRFDVARKVWVVAGTVDKVQAALAPFQLVALA